MPLESIAVTFRKGDIMSYTALYRKFRPSTFDQVKGQDHIVQTLKNQINANRIGHAIFFVEQEELVKQVWQRFLPRLSTVSIPLMEALVMNVKHVVE